MNQLNAFWKRTALVVTLLSVWQGVTAASLQDNFDMLDQWVEVEKTLTKEKYDWEIEKQSLIDIIDVYEQELEMLNEKISDAEEFTSAADSKKSGLLDEQEQFKAIEAELAGVVVAQEDQLKAILKKLPTPLVQEIAPLTQRIPRDPSDTSLSISQRLQNIVGILTQIDKFNTTVETAPEQRKFEDKTVQVTTIYFGLGAAYYADKSGEHAGYGQVTAEGWEWIPDAEIAPQVLKLINMYEGNTTEVDFIPLPININQ